MSVRTSQRVSAGMAPLIAAGVLLSACGGSDGGEATRETVVLEVGETSYETLPPATIAAPETEEAPAEDEPGGVQDYTVQAGDYGIKVADQFGVSLQDLENINGWSDASREFPGPGSKIKIPAGGTPSADTGGGDGTAEVDTAGDAEVDPGQTDEGETGEAIPEPAGDGCEPGSYEIEVGDTSRFKVAEKFDVTVEAMDAANTGTNGYDAFYPGLKIIIPAKADCG